MPLWKNKALNITEQELRIAMANSRSNAGAARFIGCGVDTYKRYAVLYWDEASQKTLWDLHKNKGAKGISRGRVRTDGLFKRAPIMDILTGKHPKYSRAKLGSRLLEEGIFKEECCKCGFHERRLTDYKVPLLLIWKDGVLTNHSIDNLEFICYNCYFLMFDDVFIKTERVNFKGF